ncbi:hypothetical protein CERSUDRAFT_69914 [Gelatoporia subvermispora B]|uniref:Uncharacterized protein n=1 Tax=Ceriporiopsis subvermispora (strain B) TaxID=914234 RepID=M2RR17_CERS8|nr:hypothetical protein CERSUDRAFT_69914 [Gelatoporia subvermispora B]
MSSRAQQGTSVDDIRVQMQLERCPYAGCRFVADYDEHIMFHEGKQHRVPGRLYCKMEYQSRHGFVYCDFITLHQAELDQHEERHRRESGYMVDNPNWDDYWVRSNYGQISGPYSYHAYRGGSALTDDRELLSVHASSFTRVHLVE